MWLPFTGSLIREELVVDFRESVVKASTDRQENGKEEWAFNSTVSTIQIFSKHLLYAKHHARHYREKVKETEEFQGN